MRPRRSGAGPPRGGLADGVVSAGCFADLGCFRRCCFADLGMSRRRAARSTVVVDATAASLNSSESPFDPSQACG